MKVDRRRSAFAVAVIAVVAFASCDGDAPVDELAGRKREILGSIGEGVVLPTLRELATRLEALEAATAAYAADPTDPNRAAAQAAWVDAMVVVERAEVMQLGPAGMGGVTTGVAGGMDVRDEIYSWPTTSTCRIDQETVEDAHRDPDVFAAEVVNVRGLDAMEYLLFVESSENTCTELSPINAEGTWDASSPEQIRQRRATYAHTLAVLASRVAVQLRDAWEPSGGDFVGALRSAGDGSELFSTAQQAMNDLAGAMLYLDQQTRDMKIAEPAGISAECPTPTCPEALESFWSGRSKEHIAENLRGFQMLYLGAASGTEGLGIDDLLVDVGAEELAMTLADAIEAAIVAVEAIPGTLGEAIAAGDPAVMAAYDAVGFAQRLFKVDVVGVLDLTPNAGPGDDND